MKAGTVFYFDGDRKHMQRQTGIISLCKRRGGPGQVHRKTGAGFICKCVGIKQQKCKMSIWLRFSDPATLSAEFIKSRGG